MRDELHPGPGLIGSAALAGLTTSAGLRAAPALPAPVRSALGRINHRGEPVSLVEGPAVALGATLAATAGVFSTAGARTAAAVLLAGAVAGSVGGYDDVVGARPEQRADKGFAGHLRALRQGRISTGAAKVAGIGAAGLACAALLPRNRRTRLGTVADVLVDAGLVAGSANLLNLFDLRPGRALKVAVLAAAPLAAAGTGGPAGRIAASVCGAAAGALPDDLGERTMLGDTGANAVGALLGVAAATGLPAAARVGVLAGIVGLTAASERVSFTAVIARTPVLRELDALGRRRVAPAPATTAPAPAEQTGAAGT